jgi:hypothetical protein
MGEGESQGPGGSSAGRHAQVLVVDLSVGRPDDRLARGRLGVDALIPVPRRRRRTR